MANASERASDSSDCLRGRSLHKRLSTVRLSSGRSLGSPQTNHYRFSLGLPHRWWDVMSDELFGRSRPGRAWRTTELPSPQKKSDRRESDCSARRPVRLCLSEIRIGRSELDKRYFFMPCPGWPTGFCCGAADWPG